MKNTLKINHEARTIIMDRTFAKLAENTRSDEYMHLQAVRQDYPNYTVNRRTIRQNTKRETYKGLTYPFMIEYIETHAADETEKAALLHEFNEMRLISQCHREGKRYPTIKQWFLGKFPKIEEFGMPQAEEKTNEKTAVSQEETAVILCKPAFSLI